VSAHRLQIQKDRAALVQAQHSAVTSRIKLYR
jgi:hypothetical protein